MISFSFNLGFASQNSNFCHKKIDLMHNKASYYSLVCRVCRVQYREFYPNWMLSGFMKIAL